MDKQVPDILRPEITKQEESWLVRVTENVTFAKRFRQIVLGNVASNKKMNLPPLVCVKPAQIPNVGYSLPVDFHESSRRQMKLSE